MHKVTLKNEDAYDLSLVVSSIVNENAEELNFKEIIRLQTLVAEIRTVADDFIKKYDAISAERKGLIEIMQKKIKAFRKSKMDDGKEIDKDFNETVESYARALTEDLNSEIMDEISPKFNELYDGIGKNEISFELEDETKTILVDNFEKFAKKKYTNKSKMIDVYKAIGGSI